MGDSLMLTLASALVMVTGTIAVSAVGERGSGRKIAVDVEREI